MLQGLKVSSSMLSSWASMRLRKLPRGENGGLNLRQGPEHWGFFVTWGGTRQGSVAADHIELNYLREPSLETTLARTADPVLRNLHQQLDGQPISIILTDAAGLVLTRLTADHDLERALAGIKLAPGFSYAEDKVGTNGIGTALEA